MAMPWPLARDFAEAATRIARERMLYAAAAARAAQATDKDWRAWVAAISGR